MLVRATFPLGALGNEMPRQLRVTRLGAERQSWTARTIWEAPADPAVPGRSFYALLDGSDLAQNEHVTAAVPVGAAQAGVTMPAEALVYGENEAWAYVASGAGQIPAHRDRYRQGRGRRLFRAQGSGIRPGQAMVVNGAGLLLARELNPSTEAED